MDVKANEMQVGGDHYRSVLQHWDVVTDHNIGYLEGCASKYVARWRKKNGLQDLQKARHFAVKLLEASQKGHNAAGRVPLSTIEHFVIANDLEMSERAVLYCLWTWQTPQDVRLGISHLDALIRQVEYANSCSKG